MLHLLPSGTLSLREDATVPSDSGVEATVRREAALTLLPKSTACLPVRKGKYLVSMFFYVLEGEYLKFMFLK